MIDIDDYIEMWNEHLLGSEGVQDLMNALIAERYGNVVEGEEE